MIRNFQILSFISRIAKYFFIWAKVSLASFQISLASRWTAIVFILGKTLRFIFFMGFIWILVKNAQNLAGYNVDQVIFFFLTFNLVDIISQFLFREVYRFRQKIVSGDFDLVLVKPLNSLFTVLMGGADILDLITIPPLIVLIGIFAAKLGSLSFWNILGYGAFILNSVLIAASFHIVVLAIGVLTTSVDHTIMIYRDLSSMGRIPIDFYREPIRGILTFVIPIGIMMAVPAKFMIKIINPFIIFYAIFFSLFSLVVAARFWNFALKRYSSASS